jgi:hypothetical protein
VTPHAILKLSPSDALALRQRALGGDLSAMKDYVLYGLWRKIQTDRFTPKRKRPKAFRTLLKVFDVQVSVHG